MVTTPTTITLGETAQRLGVHYMTAYRYVRTGRLPAQKVGQEWQVRERDIEAFLQERPDSPTPARTRGTRTREYPRRLLERLITGDEAGAWAVVEAAMSGGMSPDEVYLDLLAPALETVGRRWESGDLSIAEEHQASAVVLRLIGRVGDPGSHDAAASVTMLLGAPPHDVHGIPTALMGDLLRARASR
jgi:excisionase family DNA binding protein